MAGFALACIVGSLNLANQVRLGVAIVATVVMLGSGAIGFSIKSDYDKLSDRAEQAIEALDNGSY